ncbi:SusC/RagA family TonB-linked outer membrane protein [Flavobacteriaceae bacterium M23B6Z8]
MGTLQKYILFLLFFIPLGMMAQTVTGVITETGTGEPLPGVNVVVKGTSVGTTSDFDGNYTIQANIGDVLVFSYIGFETKEVSVNSNTLNVSMSEDTELLDEVVVIGYGTTTVKDATGSVEAVTEKEFNQGPIVSAENLIQGKVAGVTISTSGGSPGSTSTVRIRGLSSISGNTDPLYVIDGVILSKTGLAGDRNPLNLINPNDIESISVLKDASATAIYGSRGSAGVIIIQTKKGKAGGFKFNYNHSTFLSEVPDQIDALSADQFREVIRTQTDREDLLGEENTNWQDEIFRTAVGTNHNLSTSGLIAGAPFRASIGYSDLEGIIITDNLKRTNASLGYSPKFLDDHLSVDLNAKGSYIESRSADAGQIGAAVSMDPTKPVRSNDPVFDRWGGYYFWLNNAQDAWLPNVTQNPVAALELKDNSSIVRRFIGNAQLDYKFHFLPELRANLNVALDYAEGDRTEVTSDQFSSLNQPGFFQENEIKQNRQLDFYLQYTKEYETGFLRKFDIQGAYSYQNFKNLFNSRELNNNSGNVEEKPFFSNTENIQSFFGRANVNLLDKYLFTFTFRRDGSSRWTEENRWGNFPSAAFAWQMKEESFFKNFKDLSQLKLRLSYGVTGNQDLGVNAIYPSIPVYATSDNEARYVFADGTFFIIRPNAFNPALKWEETTSINAGLDFGFFNNRISGSVDIYQREIKDLLNRTAFPAGTNTINIFDANVGDMETKGVEVSLNAIVVDTEDFGFDFNFNYFYQDIEMTKLVASEDPNFVDNAGRGNIGVIGVDSQVLKVGETPFSYFVYKQVYDTNGKPIQGAFVDLNGDNRITEADRYVAESPFADVLLAFNPNLRYKKFDLRMNWRASIGNHAFNAIDSRLGHLQAFEGVNGAIQNGVENYLTTGFTNQSDESFLSDYYVQDASFIKLDNITLGYTINDTFFNKDTTIRLYGSLQNVLIISDYDGLDPEVGVDNNFYPRPRTLVLGLDVQF